MGKKKKKKRKDAVCWQSKMRKPPYVGHTRRFALLSPPRSAHVGRCVRVHFLSDSSVSVFPNRKFSFCVMLCSWKFPPQTIIILVFTVVVNVPVSCRVIAFFFFLCWLRKVSEQCDKFLKDGIVHGVTPVSWLWHKIGIKGRIFQLSWSTLYYSGVVNLLTFKF